MKEPSASPDGTDIVTELEELENRVERLRALYEQYFFGIEKVEPFVLRKDVDRRFWMMRRRQIRNTAMRFKLNTLSQRYSTYQQYWQRCTREIEAGTYRRHAIRAQKRFGSEALTIAARRRLGLRGTREPMDTMHDDASGSSDAWRDSQLEVDIDVEAEFGDTDSPDDGPPTVRNPREGRADDFGELDSLESLMERGPISEVGAAARPAARAPESERAIPSQRLSVLQQVLQASASDAPRASFPSYPDSATFPGPWRPRPTLGSVQPDPAPAPAPAPAPRRSLTSYADRGSSHEIVLPRPAMGSVPQIYPRPQFASRPDSATHQGYADSRSAASAAHPTHAAAPPRPPFPSQVPSSARTQRVPIPSKPTPKPNASPLTDERVREIYSEFIHAKRKCHEPVDGITEASLGKRLRGTADQLRGKHAGKQIDFGVVIKDGRVVLKPVVKG